MHTQPHLAPLFLLILFSPFSMFAVEGGDEKLPKRTSTANIDYKTLDGNRISCYFNNWGIFGYPPDRDEAALYWPKETGYGALYAGCLWIAGVERTSNAVRSSAGYVGTDFRPGTIQGIYTGSSSVAASTNDPRFHIYKISKSDAVGGLNPDYDQWPVDLGAPVDANGKPKFFGDQQLFFVVNDLDSAARKTMSVVPPLGIEVRVLAWCINEKSYLQDVLFIRWEIINRSIFTYDQTHIGLFEDVELGNSWDDQVGCDSTEGCGFVYNSNEVEWGYTVPQISPSMATVLLEGPARSASGNPMTSFVPGLKNISWGGLNDPKVGQLSCARTVYNYLRAIDYYGNPIINPLTARVSSYMLSGNPVTGKGWIPELGYPPYMSTILPNDKRMIVGSGPITFAPGDTQVIVAAVALAQGNDRLSSLSKVQLLARNVRSYYFNGPNVVPQIDVSAKVLSDTSGTSDLRVQAITHNIQKVGVNIVRPDETAGAVFELYDDGLHADGNALDGVFANSPRIPSYRDAQRFDVWFVVASGDTILYPSVYSRFPTIPGPMIVDYKVVDDDLNGDGRTNPGESIRAKLYLSNPSSFDYDSLAIWLSAQPAQDWATIKHLAARSVGVLAGGSLTFSVPANAVPGIPVTYAVQVTEPSHGNLWTDSVSITVEPPQFLPLDVPVEHTSGKATGTFSIHLGNPSLWQNKLYRIVIPSQGYYSVLDHVSGDTAVSRARIWSSAPWIDGFKILPGTIRAGDGLLYGIFETKGAGGTPVPPNPGQASIDPGRNVFLQPNATLEWSVSALSRYGAKPSLGAIGGGITTDHDFELRFTERGSMYYVGSKTDSMIYEAADRVPFEIWDVGTRDDSTDDVRFNVRILDRNGDGHWTPSDDTGQAEPIFGTSDAAYTEPLQVARADYYYSQYISNLLIVQTTLVQETAPRTGTVIRLVPYKSPKTDDVFVFNPVQLKRQARPVDLELRQNFPNPFNPSTTISFVVYAQSFVTLKIYNLLGQEVVTLAEGPMAAGVQSVRWDGTNSGGMKVASGVYFCQLRVGSLALIRKMVLVR